MDAEPPPEPVQDAQPIPEARPAATPIHSMTAEELMAKGIAPVKQEYRRKVAACWKAGIHLHQPWH